MPDLGQHLDGILSRKPVNHILNNRKGIGDQIISSLGLVNSDSNYFLFVYQQFAVPTQNWGNRIADKE